MFINAVLYSGIAGPPMTAGALLLMYQVAIALFIGLGPIFIMCLIFEKTKHLFDKWLMYGIGTLFSLAVFSFVSSLILGLTLRVAGALWATEIITIITGDKAEGFTNQAMQQGGIGLLMTVLLISAPKMAMSFFNTTLGSEFSAYPLIGGGRNTTGLSPGPQGQPPGSYGGGGYASQPVSNSSSHGNQSTQPLPPRTLGSTAAPREDVVKIKPSSEA